MSNFSIKRFPYSAGQKNIASTKQPSSCGSPFYIQREFQLAVSPFFKEMATIFLKNLEKFLESIRANELALKCQELGQKINQSFYTAMMRSILVISLFFMGFLEAAETTQEHQTNFGVVSNHYAAGRKGYPDGVYQTIQKYLPPKTLIVDVCSGTGISSRELYDHGFSVIGLDKDPNMITEARKIPGYDISYIFYDLKDGLQSAPSLPKTGVKAVTAFTGFHWFHDSEAAIKGIHASLQKDGYFIIVGGFGFKRGKGDSVQAEIERAIAEKIGPLPEKTVDIEKSFNGQFKIIEDTSISREDSYTAEEYLHLMRSRNYWDAYRGTDTEKKIERKITEIIEKRKGADGLIRTSGKVRVLIAQKNS